MLNRRSLLVLLGASATSTVGCLGSTEDPDIDTETDQGTVYNMTVTGEQIATDAAGDPNSGDAHDIFLWNSGSSTLSLSLAITRSTTKSSFMNETYDLVANSYAKITLYDADDYELNVVGDGIEEPWFISNEWFVRDCWTTVMRFDGEFLQGQSTSDSGCRGG